MANKPRITALIVAAGTGNRAGGGMPKQYRKLAGKPMISHSVQRLLAHPAIGSVRVIIHPDHSDLYAGSVCARVVPEIEQGKIGAPIFGGAERADSVALGLKAIAADAPDFVLIHDAARPFIGHAVIDRLLESLTADTAVVPALPVVDTVRRHADGQWEEVLRDGLMRIQTPQAFPYKLLARLHADRTVNVTDDAALWVDAGLSLRYVEGEERLQKMTTEDDILRADACRRIATGSGFDVHQLMPAGAGHAMRLGGIDIPHDHKLHGHSDADVVLHALVDALLGALSAGDIGSHFPPSDPQWKGADSKIFVAEALRLVNAQGGRIQHVDMTVICEAPKIGPHREAMRQSIAALLALPPSYVSVKATTTEQLGFTGRKEGIAAQAVATLSLPTEAV